MKRISSLWPFLLIALAVLVWNFPLYALAGRIESVSGGKLRVLDAKGSVWNGQLQLGVFDGSQVQAIPNTVQWQLQLGQNKHLAGVSLVHPLLMLPLQVGLNTSGFTIEAGELHFPATWLVAMGAPFNTIRPEGVLQLSWDNWHSDGEIKANLIWMNAESALSNIRPLGDYVITVIGKPRTNINITLATSKGPLILDGNGQWAQGQRFVFSGHAHAHEQSKQALKGLLSQMGKLEGERYRLGVF